MTAEGPTPERAAAIASMTGQGVGHAELERAPHDAPGRSRVVAEIRAVNHRYLDVRVRAASELAEHAHAAEDVVRARLGRGRIEVTLTLEGERARPALDVTRARAALEQLRELRDQVAPGEAVPLTLLAAVPDLFSSAGQHLRDERVRVAVLGAMEMACAEVSAMRAREGAVLAEDLAGRLATLLSLVQQIEQRGPRVIEAARLRLRERVARLVEPGVALDHARLEHEVALLADRADVAEECTRLRGHVAEVRRVLREPGEARGKRLDFLCQELGREANTLGQKSADAEIAARVIDLKVEIERMREQSQNVL